jgi:formylglycine-generating enzyme required for sulfatase activity
MRSLVLAAAVVILGAAATAGWAEPPATQPAKELTLDLGNKVTMELELIPAGKFLMGSPEPEEDRYKDEVQHQVTISKPFYMGKYPVTQEQWQAVMGANPSAFKFKGANKNPVENVSWNDCQDFVAKVNQKLHGQQASLPTEAQWEYACRAGTTTAYNTGDGEGALKEAGWYMGNSESKTRPVGQKKPNTWGLYDMHGNVFEWCSDWYGSYPAGEVTDPMGPKQGGLRVLRGGCSLIFSASCRSATRIWKKPGDRDNCTGVRVVVAAGTD